MRLLAEKGLIFFAIFGRFGEIDSAVATASGFFRAVCCSLGFLKFDQKGCMSEGGLCAEKPRGDAIFGQQESLSVTSW